MIDTIKAIEVTNTWQGEGIDSGQRMLLVRFKYCNKNCQYCDTLLKMRISMEAEYNLMDLQKMMNIEKLGILITGGEPTLEKHFDDTITLLNNLNYPIANVESNGYNLEKLINSTSTNKNIHFIYSPKIFDYEDLNNEIEKIDQLYKYNNVFVKVVYQNNQLIYDYLLHLKSLNINNRVFLMPEGKSRQELLSNAPNVFNTCEQFKFNFSSRVHLIYNFL